MGLLDDIKAKKDEEARAKLSETEKLMFANQEVPIKINQKLKDLTASLPPGEGTIPNYKYKKDEIDPAFTAIPKYSAAEVKLQREFEEEMAKLGNIVIAPDVVKVGIAKDYRNQKFVDSVNEVIDDYLDTKEAKACRLYCEAVRYEERFVEPILERDMTFFREIEQMGFVQIALMVKANK